MISTTHLLSKLNIRHHDNQGIAVSNVADANTGVDLAYRVIAETIDRKTVLYLSGGSTPKNLYQRIAQAEEIIPAAVGMVDERYGPKWHAKSNELMIQETGLLRYLSMRAIPFYPVLDTHSREATADRYDQQVRELTATFQQSIGILGIGTDGHTSSLAPNRKDFQNPMFGPSQRHLLISEFNDPKSSYKERVGMTFLGLSMLDLLIVMVFGTDKKDAVAALFEEGSEEEIPARVYKRPDIAKKTLFITDQNV